MATSFVSSPEKPQETHLTLVQASDGVLVHAHDLQRRHVIVHLRPEEALRLARTLEEMARQAAGVPTPSHDVASADTVSVDVEKLP